MGFCYEEHLHTRILIADGKRERSQSGVSLVYVIYCNVDFYTFLKYWTKGAKTLALLVQLIVSL